MSIINFFRNRINIVLILGSIFLFLFFLEKIKIDRSTDEFWIKEQIQNEVREKDNLLTKNMNLLKSKFSAENINSENEFNFDNELLSGEGILLLAYKNNSLKFWTDNSLPFPNEFDSLWFTDRIIDFGNGWYLTKHEKLGRYNFVTLALIKSKYKYDNEYLESEFNVTAKIGATPLITLDRNEYPIFDVEDSYLFSLDFAGGTKVLESDIIVLFITVALLFICIILLLFYLHQRLFPLEKWKNLAIIAFAIDAIIVRGLMQYFHIPFLLYDSELFGPDLFSCCALLPSLGDLFYNSLLVFMIAYLFNKHWKVSDQWERKNKLSPIVIIGFFVVGSVLWFFFYHTSSTLILDSTLNLNLNTLANLNVLSLIGLLILGLMTYSVVLFFNKANEIILACKRTLITILGSLLLALTILMVLLVIFKTDRVEIEIALMLLFTFLTYLFAYRYKFSIISKNIVLIILLSIVLTFILHTRNHDKEKEERTLVAHNISDNQDPMAEFLFNKISEEVLMDTALATMVLADSINEELVITYLLQDYFDINNSFWSKYNFQVTLCDPYQNLIIGNTGELNNCHQFFDDQINDWGKMSLCDNLYFMEDLLGQGNYLGVFSFENELDPERGNINIYIEIYPKIIPADIGYLELLVDKTLREQHLINNYAHARYVEGELVSSYGKFHYPINLSKYGKRENKQEFFEYDDFSHLYYRIDPGTVLIISKEKNRFLNIITPFSYLLLFLMISGGIGLFLRNLPLRDKLVRSNFKSRLQYSLFTVIIVSFIFIGFTSIYYLRDLNRKKNDDSLSEKARSIRIELEHKLADKQILTPEIQPYIQSLLVKFNAVFATDINLYSLNGKLLASSRPQIFDEGLLAEHMNAIALQEMSQNNRTLYIHDESIGKLEYISAYIPFRNNENNVIAYLNLPYFARQSELSNEISNFLMAFVNIYILLILLTILIAYVISNYIAKPLQLIRDKIKLMQLGKTNEKIELRGDDELGQLVKEYNRMLDELSESAVLLAKSERESAWREMARQIAHEIKNPLTPMKLSVQYLKKAWDEKAEDWDDRLDKFSHNLIEQIDSLSLIATEFSDFANMPKADFREEDLKLIIQKNIELFHDYEGVNFSFDSPKDEAIVIADKEQLSRVFTNLITNAIQAKRQDVVLDIDIRLKKNEDEWLVEVQDNGKGIPEELRDKIFMPSFTTKSSGMGLGLAIVRNIINNMGGSISFKSFNGNGTVFYIHIPTLEKKNHSDE